MTLSIKLKLKGFEDLLKDIEKAGGSINAATRECMDKSAAIMETELKSKMQSANVPQSLIGAMPAPKIESSGNRITARVGYEKGVYDPKNPSDAYKVIFLNYGTPKRTQHGKVAKRGFIQKAKRSAKKKIKAEQERTLNEILKGLTQ